MVSPAANLFWTAAVLSATFVSSVRADGEADEASWELDCSNNLVVNPPKGTYSQDACAQVSEEASKRVHPMCTHLYSRHTVRVMICGRRVIIASCHHSSRHTVRATARGGRGMMTRQTQHLHTLVFEGVCHMEGITILFINFILPPILPFTS